MIPLALIPARIGSKGIPKKNLKVLGGFPLVAWAIRAACRSGIFQNVVISSDSKDILRVALKYGATDSIYRPKKLALDSTKQFEVIRHALEVFENIVGSADSIMLLQPTSPFRRIQDIKSVRDISGLYPSKTVISVVNASKDHETLYHYGKLSKLTHSLTGSNARGTLRQDFEPKWKRDGSIYVMGRAQIESQRLFSDSVVGYEIPNWMSCNIDDAEDFVKASLRLSDPRIKKIREELFD